MLSGRTRRRVSELAPLEALPVVGVLPQAVDDDVEHERVGDHADVAAADDDVLRSRGSWPRPPRSRTTARCRRTCDQTAVVGTGTGSRSWSMMSRARSDMPWRARDRSNMAVARVRSPSARHGEPRQMIWRTWSGCSCARRRASRPPKLQPTTIPARRTGRRARRTGRQSVDQRVGEADVAVRAASRGRGSRAAAGARATVRSGSRWRRSREARARAVPRRRCSTALTVSRTREAVYSPIHRGNSSAVSRAGGGPAPGVEVGLALEVVQRMLPTLEN